jgi:hypothetical protein
VESRDGDQAASGSRKTQGEENVAEAEGAEEAVSDRPFPALARWLAAGLNILLLSVEVGYLIPRWVGDDEIVMVTLTVGAAVVTVALLIDYFRRGLLGDNRRVRAGDLQPIPIWLRWGAISMNLLALFSQGVLLSSRGGVNLRALHEVLVTSLLVGTPVVSLAILLDYNRRGL